jgi:rhamnosyltransferase
VVVTYNPDESCLDCLGTILAAAAHTVIVDNRSAEACRPALARLRSPAVTFVENAENTGVGAALNQGIRVAAGLGYGWFLLFDQDTKILAATLDELVGAARECLAETGPQFGFLGANFFGSRTDGSVGDALVPFAAGQRWIAREIVITSGTLLSRESFEAIGPFREDFFVDHVDHEYCLRARRRGLVVGATVQPVLVHRQGLRAHRRLWWMLGARKSVTGYSPLRRYYQIRNLLWLAREYGRDFPATVDRLRAVTWRDARRGLRYEDRLFLNLMAIALAWWHVRRGVSGRYPGRLLHRP